MDKATKRKWTIVGACVLFVMACADILLSLLGPWGGPRARIGLLLVGLMGAATAIIILVGEWRRARASQSDGRP